MKGRTALLALLPLLAGLVACKTGGVELTDEDAVQAAVEEDLSFLLEDLGNLMNEDSSYGGLAALGLAKAPIEGQLRVWYRRIDPRTRTLDLQIRIQNDTAWVDIGRRHEGTFNLWYSPPGDTGAPDTLIRYGKPLADTLFRKVMLVRRGSVSDRHRGWRIEAYTIGQGHALPTTNLGIDSVVVEFYDSVTVEDADTSDGRVDRIVCTGNLLKTLVIQDPSAWIHRDSVPTVPPRACARVKLYGSPAGTARAFLHFNNRMDRHVRHPFVWDANENAWVGQWFTPFFLSGTANRFHVAFDLIAESTFTDDSAPYDAVFWFMPYWVSAP